MNLFEKNVNHQRVTVGGSAEMPGKVKVRVVAGRGLPVMDRSADTTDAFAEVIVVTIQCT